MRALALLVLTLALMGAGCTEDCSNGACPSRVDFNGVSYYVIWPKVVALGEGDVRNIGEGKGFGVEMVDNAVYALNGVPSTAVIAFREPIPSESTTAQSGQFGIAVARENGRASAASMWSVPGLCQYAVDPEPECGQ